MRRVVFPASRLAAFVALSASVCGPALAHAHLKSASPGAGATVHDTPKAVTLTFSEGIVAKFSGIDLTDAAGKPVPLGAVAVGDNAASLTASVAGALTPGAYTVRWHAVAKDSHRTSGSFRFTLAP